MAKKATKKKSSQSAITSPSKTNKKSSRKKAAKKKAVSFTKAKGNARFMRSDGKQIASLIDLADQLHEMADDVFYHHVTPDRNDFATWVNDVFKEAQLAEEIAKTSTPNDSCYVVMRHIIKRHK